MSEPPGGHKWSRKGRVMFTVSGFSLGAEAPLGLSPEGDGKTQTKTKTRNYGGQILEG